MFLLLLYEDFIQEARNSERTAKNISKDTIKVPRVFWVWLLSILSSNELKTDFFIILIITDSAGVDNKPSSDYAILQGTKGMVRFTIYSKGQ